MSLTTAQLFTEARTQNGYLPTPVADATLRQLYELVKYGPTAANSCPARFAFVRSAEAKARLLEAVSPGNVEKIRQAPLTSKLARDYVRIFLSGASDERPDKQHRVTIPPALREYAGLDRDLTVIGAGDRAEIWATEAWNAYYAEKEEAFSTTEEEVIPGLF